MASSETSDPEDSSPNLLDPYAPFTPEDMKDSESQGFYYTLPDREKDSGFDEWLMKFCVPSPTPIIDKEAAPVEGEGQWASVKSQKLGGSNPKVEKISMGKENMVPKSMGKMKKASSDDGGWITVKPKRLRVSSNHSKCLDQNVPARCNMPKETQFLVENMKYVSSMRHELFSNTTAKMELEKANQEKPKYNGMHMAAGWPTIKSERMEVQIGIRPVMLSIIRKHCPWMLQLGPPREDRALQESILPLPKKSRYYEPSSLTR